MKIPFFFISLFLHHILPGCPLRIFKDKTEAGTYGDFTAMVDAMVGQILQTLDSLNYADNTLVIFTSDNGPFWTPALIEQFQHRAAGNLRGMKADAYEGGHRVPFIARWPEQYKSRKHEQSTGKSHQFIGDVRRYFRPGH